METTLTLYVRYLAKPGCRENFLRQLTTEGIIDAIRQEDGCLRYDYFLSVQNADEILLVGVGGKAAGPPARGPYGPAAGAEGPVCGGRPAG